MYNPKHIEQKWQQIWEESALYQADSTASAKKLYVLDMFPYPSGDGLHVGHSRIYTASDTVTRMKRMQGHTVLHPTGWDAFGLPAENYAIKTGTHPRITTEKNIANAKQQMKAQGFLYDWSREINTTDPKYYRWTQWIFIQLFKKGLAYEAEVPINWCPKDKTGLANEEVIGGRCDRCGTLVERRKMRQWLLKITDYAEKLLQGLDKLDWPESIKTMQRNWIGRSEGALVRFLLAEKPDEYIETFTTRPDTLFGATYIVLAPEHPLVNRIVTQQYRSTVEVYQKSAGNKTDIERTELQKEKTGVFTGTYAINPVNGVKIPIWVADYVLVSYGTGAIMAVPAHDERDSEFARKYNLPIIEVVKADKAQTPQSHIVPHKAKTPKNESVNVFTGEGQLINSGTYNGLATPEARKKIVNDLEGKGLSEPKVHYKLRDWVFSRQRYWGEPIPMVSCAKCGTVPVPEDQLPILLPEVEKYQPTGTGESPLASITEWVETTCPNCGGEAQRETNTMPQWAGSSWYFLRFTDPHNDHTLASKDALNWMPVDIYIGGAEHAVLHLLYARFWHMFLHDLGVVKDAEPFTRLESVGLVLAKAYKDKAGHYVHYDDVIVDGAVAFHKTTHEPLESEIEKMSKSKGNVVSPDLIIQKYGADTLRVYSMFLGPWNEMSLFDLSSIEGSFRFLKKAYALLEKKQSNKNETSMEKIVNVSILKVTNDIERFAFNTAVSQLMILANHLNRAEVVSRKHLEIFVQLLSPFAPHLAEEMWENLGHSKSVLHSRWPEAQASEIKDETVEIVVQVNGKVRGRFTVPRDTDNDRLVELAKSNTGATQYLNNQIEKTITVPNKLVSFVLKKTT